MPEKTTKETPVVFHCHGQQLLGMIHHSNQLNDIGLLIVVGGSQYRVGSHRQFLLLARFLSDQNFAIMRFDVRGMGDSEGITQSFEQIDDDIRAAIDCFFATLPALKGVALWGLCDAASASLFYANQDPRVKGLALLNPWLHTQQGAAKIMLKHYYLQRVFSADFWQKVLHFNFNYRKSLLDLFKKLKQFASISPNLQSTLTNHQLPLPVRLRESLKQFRRPVLLILSGHDFTAAEFKETVKNDTEWQVLLNHPQVTRHDLVEADHTFSTAVWTHQVEKWTMQWLNVLKQ